MTEINSLKIDLLSKEVVEISLEQEKPILQDLYQLISEKLISNQLIKEEDFRNDFEQLYKTEVNKISNLDTSNVNTFRFMFGNTGIKYLNLTSFNTSISSALVLIS